MRSRSCLYPLAFCCAIGLSHANDGSLSDSQLSSVQNRLEDAAHQSWEFGTRAQALLELDASPFSVFSDTSLPPPHDIADMTENLQAVLDIAESVVSNQSSRTAGQARPLLPDGSSGDPASIGVAVLLANWTGQDRLNYSDAATGQLNYLLNVAPRYENGAISHRTASAQLWSDSVFMVPPFLAYYGVLNSNQSLVEEAYNQCKLYRDILRDSDNGNLWKHIVGKSDSPADAGYWSTGNGWAAAGMLRVLATIQHSPYSDALSNEMEDLVAWIKEIQGAMYDKLDDSYVFRNYVDKDDAFYDASSTALMAATVYRLSDVWDDHTHIPLAQRSRNVLLNGKHIDDDGWLTPVVNPHSYGVEGSKSAEGQAFVLMMESAHAVWHSAGEPGNGAAFVEASKLLTISTVLIVYIALL
ncbi:Six-hairpin glycosidase [Cylindrobasidium torrendii FP15055 ss-10]|uniref:Six-hairpin glycosidase n=1 Tax=Cylindrobasidium torrendii FP15055 ss-10 TaxID=1314674 RepID=A0A0D7B0H8_9AGAR|nr:Six-hairpin glycosidase [Cylindrobasidium torrendii FP15055 ss-10]